MPAAPGTAPIKTVCRLRGGLVDGQPSRSGRLQKKFASAAGGTSDGVNNETKAF